MKFEKVRKREKYFYEIRHKCKCGHTVYIPKYVEYILCSWCGCKVYQDNKAEFKDKLLMKMRKA